jgi:exodeoxyribonuclease III
VKIATWNVNGIRARSSQVAHWIDGEEPDVICLQEIKATPAQVPEPLAQVAGYHAHWHGGGGYSGVALLLHARRFSEPPAFVHPPFDLEHRIVVAEVGALVLASVYVPNGGKDFPAKLLFLRELEAWAGALAAAGKHLVLSGDLNVARTPVDVHPSLRKDMVGQLAVERELIDRLFSHGLVDVGRYVDPDNDRLFTWWAPWRNLRQRNIGWRLDYVAASHALVDPKGGVAPRPTGEAGRVPTPHRLAPLVDATTTCKVYRDVGTSDHAPVVAHIRDEPF